MESVAFYEIEFYLKINKIIKLHHKYDKYSILWIWII